MGTPQSWVDSNADGCALGVLIYRISPSSSALEAMMKLSEDGNTTDGVRFCQSLSPGKLAARGKAVMMPGLGNFIAEFLVLSGSFKADMIITAIASIGLVLGTVYSLRIFQRVFQGPKNKEWTMQDLNWREIIVIGSLVIVILWLGFYPQPVINIVKPVIVNVLGNL